MKQEFSTHTVEQLDTASDGQDPSSNDCSTSNTFYEGNTEVLRNPIIDSNSQVKVGSPRKSHKEYASDDAPYKDEELDDKNAQYLRRVFEQATADGSKEILFVRACAPTDDKQPDQPGFGCAEAFKNWHSVEVRASGADPSLSETAYLAASTGVPREVLQRPGLAEFGGLEGGLQELVRLFAPQVVVSSPNSSALQTALTACERHDDPGCTIILHPDLKHIKKDLTAGGLFPEGKPKFQGVTVTALRQSLARCNKEDKVDLSELEEVWFDPSVDFKGQKRRVRNVPQWLSQRSEQRIMVVTHNRVLRFLVGAKIGNGQYALARLSTSGDLYTTPTISSFDARFDAHGDEEDQPCSSGPPPRRVLFVRHCQDETLPLESDPRTWGRDVAPRFQSWHSKEQRDLDIPEHGRWDPCLTQLGIQAASSGIDDQLRDRMNQANGYGGVRGGLRQILDSFGAEVVVTSPLSRALQTAIVAFDDAQCPVIVHPALKELKKDYTFQGRYPNGKPGCSGIATSALRAAIARHPRVGGGEVDTSLLVEEDWFDPHQTHQAQLHNLEDFTHWMARRPEERIVVISHGGVLRQLLKTELSHGQYVITEMQQTKTKPKFVIVQFSSGVQPYVEI